MDRCINGLRHYWIFHHYIREKEPLPSVTYIKNLKATDAIEDLNLTEIYMCTICCRQKEVKKNANT